MIREEDKVPVVSPMYDFYLDAFSELGTERNSSMSVGHIPFSAIVRYAKLYKVEDIDEFLYVIRQMDNAFIDFHGENNGKTST